MNQTTMNHATKPEGDSRFYSWIFKHIVDPALIPIRKRVKRWIPEGATLIDFGCGTGAQLIDLHEWLGHGLGIDLSSSQVDQAMSDVRALGISNLEFAVADATQVDSVGDKSYDLALASLVIHEMPETIRIPVLKEMRRVARQIIIVDWEVKQRNPYRTLSTHLIERLAGRTHYQGFRSFIAAGGIPVLLKRLELDVIEEQETSTGTMRLWLCE